MTKARLIPNIDGDTIIACHTCAHALLGYDPEDIGLTEYTPETLEGCRQILTKTNGRLHDEEETDSNLIPKCDVCLTPKAPFQWYTVIAALHADAHAFNKGI